jgi:hypothetical protein
LESGIETAKMLYANYYQPDRVKNASFEEIDRHHTFNPTFTNRLLRAEFLKRGVELNNPDVNNGKEVAFSIFHDGQVHQAISGPKYIIATENPYICPLNQDKNYLSQFDGIFTWNPDLLTLPNAMQIFIPNQIRNSEFASYAERPIFSCLINANKAFPRVLSIDLYRERLNVIRWYQDYAPNFFSLYGLGWNKPAPAFTPLDKLRRRFKRLATQVYGYKPFPSYQGAVENKADVYSKAKFAYCYENVADLPDYITEKIFDAFFSGCVPIYWGSNTIQDYIPSSCYIDRTQFKSTQEVHQHLLGISEERYQEYQSEISRFLLGSVAQRFDTQTYTSTIIHKISLDLGL